MLHAFHFSYNSSFVSLICPLYTSTGVTFWVFLYFHFPFCSLVISFEFLRFKSLDSELQCSCSSLCAYCCKKRKWMPRLVLLFLKMRNAAKEFTSKELLRLGMSCFSILHLLKKSLWRNLTLWVCSQTPKKATSLKPLKNIAKGRTRHHKKRHWCLFQSPRKATSPKPPKNSIKGRKPYHKKRIPELMYEDGNAEIPNPYKGMLRTSQ